MHWKPKKPVWVIADTHFNHAGILNFNRDDGKPVRPGFADLNHMNEHMITQWNSVVGDYDIVYHLGDVRFGAKDWMIDNWGRLKGKKRLILGNHDDPAFLGGKDKNGHNFFEKIMLWREIPDLNLVLSHVPLYMTGDSNHQKCAFNVHGHIHAHAAPTNRHYCVSVEQLDDYRPVNINVIAAALKKRKI